MKDSKERLDVLLYSKHITESREKAKALIMSGVVYVNGVKETKAGQVFSSDSEIEVRGPKLEFVSRGGLKLKKAIQEFNIDLKDKICIDIGASTGGFTDCMLKNNALKVYCVDVGYGQLDWSLRNNPKVVSMEKTNARYLEPTDFDDDIDFISVDVSFISLTKILKQIYKLLIDDGLCVCLIKPQFEANRNEIKKNGVVRDLNVHKRVVSDIIDFAKSIGFTINDLSFSPIKGPKGNIEYLLFIKKSINSDSETVSDLKVSEVVENAFKELKSE